MKTQLFVYVLVAAAACGGHHGDTTAPGAPSPLADQVLVQSKDLPPGLDLRVSAGKAGAPAYDHTKLAPATKLGDAVIAKLLARARPLQSEAADQQAFALRPASQPPPRAGATIHGTFPPPPSSLLPPKSSEAGKDLQVLRYMPEGEVPLAPTLSVTFSQPMVAVTSQGDAAGTVPVQLSPTPKGSWRWIGTRTILFQPDVRFPQATTYHVTIPAGTKSTLGGALNKAVSFSFETPAPRMVAHFPDGGPQRVDTPMWVEFDQKIDPQAVLGSIHVTSAGNQLRLAPLSAADLAKNKELASIVKAAHEGEQDGRWLAFRATSELPKDADISVELAAGLPSAEGPNRTKAAQSFSFHTYPPLRVEESDCGWGGPCRPDMAFSIRFDNPLDEDKFDDAQVTITPAIPDVKITQSGTVIGISGATAAHTTYKVTLSKDLTDAFGQTLGKDATRTFDVGDAEPTFFGPSGMVVLDPVAKQPALDFFTTNYERLKVRLYKVTPRDLDAYSRFLENQWDHDHLPPVPGRKVADKLVSTTHGKDRLVETALDLSGALDHGLGDVLAIVEPYPWKESYPPPRMIAWVQSTQLAVDAHVDGDHLVAFASELATGKPAANVALELRPSGERATTDDQGLAQLPLPTRAVDGVEALVAHRGDDTAFVMGDGGSYNSSGDWMMQVQRKALTWYVIDDRQMYRPGEEVSLKGWLRLVDEGKGGDVEGLGGQVSSVRYKVYDAEGNQIGVGSAPVSPVGGFDTKFTLPKTPNLGYARVEFESQGARREAFTHRFQIQEFRRPEFEVDAQASQGPFLVGGSADVTVSAKYYAGGPLPGADVSWTVTASPTSFTPPNRDDYVFGRWQPWWGYDDAVPERSDEGGPRSWTLAGKTDATGAHVMHLDFLSLKPPVPMSVTANATVVDVNRQAWTKSVALIVHPASRYVGLKLDKVFVDQGTPMHVGVIGVDLDGKAAPGAKIEVKDVRLDWQYKHGKYTTKEVDPHTCSLIAAADPGTCDFSSDHGGRYRITATIVDPQGRPNQTSVEYWVSGGEEPPARDVAQQKVQLIPDKKTYQDGDTAELLAQAPFYPAEGIVTWRRSGIVKTERITFTGPTQTIHVPIQDAMVPDLYVQVDLVGAAPRTDDRGQPDPSLPRRPAYAVGSLELSVPPRKRTLAVKVSPAAPKVSPGAATHLSLDIKDAAGRPVAGASAAVIVVDEAVLSLTGYQFPDPIDTFYAQRVPGAADYYERSYVKLAKPDVRTIVALNEKLRMRRQATRGDAMDDRQMAREMAPPPPAAAPVESAAAQPMKKAEDKFAPGGGGASTSTAPIAIRSNFNPLAAFSPTVTTDANGHAEVDVKVPDNLTRYRIVAIAVAGDRQFGKGESALTARLPLMIRPSPPRFLNFGDTFELPVVVQNQTDAPMTVDVAVRTTNAALTDGGGRELTVPANDRVEVRFPAAAEMAGTARFQIVGASGNDSDAAELALPVWTPATTEAFATYGVIDHGAVAQKIALPGKVVTQFGGLEVSTASTNLQSLTDALLYLVHYPFECAEQRSSRIVAIAALRDVLAAFHTKDMPTPAQMEQSVAADIDHLSQMQNADGGFAFWDRGYPSQPYLSVYVVNALAHAKAKGFAVPQALFDRARPYIQNIEAHYPSYYSKEVRWAISAYALYTRKQLGDLDIAKGQRLLKEAGGVGKVSMETDGWLLALFAGNPQAAAERAAIVRYALNHVSETAGAANFTTSYGDGNYLLLASDRRVDGVMLDALIQEQPKLDLIPKIVTGLLAHRNAGHWLSTQENAFVLLALDRYFHTYEKTTPDFVARVWLGKDYAGDHPFKGRQTDRFAIDIPMKTVATHDGQDLTIAKDGAGRLYYRIGMTYAPASLMLAPADYGFVVQREYEAVDDPKDVTRTPDGTWHFKAGARVRVKLTMVNTNRRYHVALVDPLPAGLEPMNPALAVTGPIPQDPKQQQERGAYWWWYGPWYDHQNMRDERVEAFAALLWEGVHTYEYVARATTPGHFVVPPPKAEEMYMPETFGRGASDRVVVE